MNDHGMNDHLEMFEDVSNPLDSIEDILQGNEWNFSRPHPDEITVHVSGKSATYRLTFLWQEEYSAMQFFCEYDMNVPRERIERAGPALRTINEKLWLGHFDLPADTGVPCFRHTSLFRGWTNTSGAEHVEDLVDIGLAECERYYNAFSMMASATHLTDEMMSFILADGAGEA